MGQGAWWEAVTDGGGASLNEDLVRVFGPDGADGPLDILVIDGDTSLVAPGEDGGNLDVVWFVARFADEFGRVRSGNADRAALLAQAAHAASQAYAARTAGRELPPYAWPVASLAWLRIEQRSGGDGWRTHVTSLGDCKVLLRAPDGAVRDLDPIDNAQEASLYDEVAQLRAGGVLDPKARFERMLPLLRARRTAQNIDPAPVVLSARPQGPYATRQGSFAVAPGAMLLVTSDGFWRPVEPYGECTAHEFARRCAVDGLDAVLARLRAWEAGAGGAGSLAVKRADDASAVAWHADGAPRG
jgi:hypothetical protein